jgi:hypothetical protein
MRRRLLGAALPLAVVLVPATALAINLGDAGGVSYRLHASHAAANHTADSLTDCPKGKSPTGGGYLLSAEDGFDQFDVAASKPFDGPDAGHEPDDGWEVRGLQPDHGATAFSFAICAAGDHRYLSNDHSAFGPSRVKVGCPADRHVTGGGGSLGKPASSTLIASFPIDGNDRDSLPDDGWEAWGYAQPKDRLRAFAVCSKKKPAYHSMVDPLDPGRGSREDAFCGDGQHLLGVGGRVGDAPSQTAEIELAEPDDFNRDQVYDDTGAVFGVNALDGQPGINAEVVAICKR